MSTFTEKELDTLIRAVITETSEGVYEWFKNETIVVNKTTKESLDDVAEITLRSDPKKPLTDYVYSRLEKYGITINKNK